MWNEIVVSLKCQMVTIQTLSIALNHAGTPLPTRARLAKQHVQQPQYPLARGRL